MGMTDQQDVFPYRCWGCGHEKRTTPAGHRIDHDHYDSDGEFCGEYEGIKGVEYREPCPIGKDTGKGCTCTNRCKPAHPARTAEYERAVIVAWLRARPADGETESYARDFAREIEEGRHDDK